MNDKTFIKAENLTKWFDLRSSFTEKLFGEGEQFIKAVDGINFEIREGETFGLVGESGCGKTTTGRLLMNTIKPTAGKIIFDGVDLSTIKDKAALKALTRKMQMIFQDPYEYLSPWLDVRNTLAEPIRIHKLAENTEEEDQMIRDIMETVDLTPLNMILPKYAYELSG